MAKSRINLQPWMLSPRRFAENTDHYRCGRAGKTSNLLLVSDFDSGYCIMQCEIDTSVYATAPLLPFKIPNPGSEAHH
jgi:hypothetical protein